MKKLSIERIAALKHILSGFIDGYDTVDDRENFEAMRDSLSALDELIALKGDQVPVGFDADIIRDANRYRFLRNEDAWGEDSDSWDLETRTGLISSENLMGGLSPDHFDAAIDARMAASDIPFLNPATAPKKTVVLLNSSTVMSRAYVVKQIEDAGCIVSTSDQRLMQDMSGIVKDVE